MAVLLTDSDKTVKKPLWILVAHEKGGFCLNCVVQIFSIEALQVVATRDFMLAVMEGHLESKSSGAIPRHENGMG